MKMVPLEEIRDISVVSASKIVMLVIDGLGGLPDAKTGHSELETAHTPHLDQLAKKSICGLIDPVGPGITTGSGPGHLALFGYDPLKFTIGRGVLEALGIGFELQKNDIAARGNFCTVDGKGVIIDRRAGRINTDKCIELCTLLAQIKLQGVKSFVLPVKEHRFSLVMRGKELHAELSDTDPQKTGVIPYPAKHTKAIAKHTADIVN